MAWYNNASSGTFVLVLTTVLSFALLAITSTNSFTSALFFTLTFLSHILGLFCNLMIEEFIEYMTLKVLLKFRREKMVVKEGIKVKIIRKAHSPYHCFSVGTICVVYQNAHDNVWVLQDSKFSINQRVHRLDFKPLVSKTKAFGRELLK